MDLQGLVQNSDRIFRAKVISVTPGSIRAGGGKIPTLAYELQIVESFKGPPETVARLTMVTSPPEDSREGVQRFPIFRDVPELREGRDYVLFVTRPSSLGLSTTVGLGQGCFDVLVQDNNELVVNKFNNAGLGLQEPTGPVSYGALAAAIQSHDSK